MNHQLHPIREYYLNCFRESVAKARSELDQFTTELLLEMSTLKHKEYCYRLYRVDIIGKKNGESKILEVNVTERQVMKPESFSTSGVCFDAPLVWNGIEFEVKDSSPNETALLDWASRWMDISESKYKEVAEFQEVVHSIKPPTITASGFNISVDFGSAPTSGFDELTEILSRDSRKVSVGSFFLFRENA
jgi:hypothetical protein